MIYTLEQWSHLRKNSTFIRDKTIVKLLSSLAVDLQLLQLGWKLLLPGDWKSWRSWVCQKLFWIYFHFTKSLRYLIGGRYIVIQMWLTLLQSASRSRKEFCTSWRSFESFNAVAEKQQSLTIYALIGNISLTYLAIAELYLLPKKEDLNPLLFNAIVLHKANIVVTKRTHNIFAVF